MSNQARRAEHQTYEMTCTQCGELRWPYLTTKPNSYTCYRCRSGVGVARREAARRSMDARKSRIASKRQQERPS